MKNSQKFYGKANCLKVVDILKSIMDKDGIENFNGELILSREQSESAINQFEVAALKGGKYFPSIISEPHFSQKEIDCILYYVPLKGEFLLFT